MRERVKLKDLQVRQRIRPIPVMRSSDYLRLRHFWLAELCWIKAKVRNGTASQKDIKIIQKELVRIRKDG